MVSNLDCNGCFWNWISPAHISSIEIKRYEFPGTLFRKCIEFYRLFNSHLRGYLIFIIPLILDLSFPYKWMNAWNFICGAPPPSETNFCLRHICWCSFCKFLRFDIHVYFLEAYLFCRISNTESFVRFSHTFFFTIKITTFLFWLCQSRGLRWIFCVIT